jgi:hypothetical protein
VDYREGLPSNVDARATSTAAGGGHHRNSDAGAHGAAPSRPQGHRRCSEFLITHMDAARSDRALPQPIYAKRNKRQEFNRSDAGVPKPGTPRAKQAGFCAGSDTPARAMPSGENASCFVSLWSFSFFSGAFPARGLPSPPYIALKTAPSRGASGRQACVLPLFNLFALFGCASALSAWVSWYSSTVRRAPLDSESPSDALSRCCCNG